MNFSMPIDAHELDWLTSTAINAHCDISSDGRSTLGFGVWYKSTVSHLLSEANHARFNRYGGVLLPLLVALSAMDQYGMCYESVPATFPLGMANKSGIIKSAHNFLGIHVNTPDSEAIYALRNALMHQSSLISVGKQATPKHYWFEIDNTIEGLFSHAAQPWDGKFNTRSIGNKTTVNASAMLDLALKLPGKLKNEHKNGKLNLILSGGLEELLTNYVELEFEGSFRDSYLRYLGAKIHDSLECPPAGAAEAELILKGVLPEVLDEAALVLAANWGGAGLKRLADAYPVVKGSFGAP